MWNTAQNIAAGSVHQGHTITIHPPQAVTPTPTGSAAEALKQAVHKQWREETRKRGLHLPTPLPVDWAIRKGLAVSRETNASVSRETEAAVSRETPLAVSRETAISTDPSGNSWTD
ncbi:hypothetical protein ACFU90_09495 [Streptomyces noursei]|uniref:hypothetical protein n=1 Tax=Streptomyces noursei TaxID=1971 RepID=UPI0013001A7C|nr:hypothetical protein [Streptomyces noursei]MCZ0972938.1 hypothetical protein [Streptomyces noursei]